MAALARRPGGNRGRSSSPHSFRCADDVWRQAKLRADQEGVPMSYVIEQFITGYAHGMLNLPQVKVQYDTPQK